MSKLVPGKYEAKILEYGLVEGARGPQVKVVFGIKNGPSYSWFGQLATEKNQEITTKNLMIMGANPSNIDKVENGAASGVLDQNKVFELVIEDRVYNGKTYTEIKYINDPSTPRTPAQEFKKGTGALVALKGQAAAMAASAPKQAAKEDDISF